MNQKQRAQWEQTRAKGMTRFILLHIVLISSGMIIGTSIYDYFTSFNGFRFKDLYIKVPIYLVSSFVLGVIIWLIADYKYEKSSQTNQSKLNSIYLKVLALLVILVLLIVTMVGLYLYLSSGNISPGQNAGQGAFSNQYANQNFATNLVEDMELIPFSKGGKFGFCDKEKKLVIEAKYDFVEPFSNNLALVNIGMTMNAKGEIVETGTYGFIDKTGTEVIPLKYKYADSFSEGLAFVTSQVKDRKTNVDTYYSENPTHLFTFERKGGMFIDVKGNPVFTVKYDHASSFVEGFSKVVNRIPGKEGYFKMGFVDKTGKELVPLIYDYVGQFSEGLALVSVDTKKAPKVGFIDVTGKVVIPIKFNSRYSGFSDGLAVQRTDAGFVLINKLGEEVYQPAWEKNLEINEFSEGYATAFKPEIKRMGFVDKDGQEFSFKYMVVRGFKDGLALARSGRESGYKSGYIDKTGREVIPIKYDYAEGDFSNGLAYVRLGQNTFYIDKKGTEYYEP